MLYAGISNRFLQFFPQAEVHRLADAGHYVVEDAYERIGPLVEHFLDAHPLRPAVSTDPRCDA